MGGGRIARLVTAALAYVCLASSFSAAHAQLSQDRDGSVAVAGRKLSCASVQSVLNSRIPMLGIAVPARKLLVLNPQLLQRHSDTVRLFVFNHECGHHHVGGSEFKADCWAVERGLREGWLGRSALSEVCQSFGGTPETFTHPSAARRCVNLAKCFASVEAALAAEKRAERMKAAVVPADAPTLVSDPSLVRAGTAR